ncbi:hypothetical protein [Frankia sp. CiP3]|uniref:hypothetical protein n=1 Tax=Frankia sp. CiP3 TaxID=2880971 RepID=UPI001EF3D9FB|nr:hypothetical protein [Frankia sp. CiP3]
MTWDAPSPSRLSTGSSRSRRILGDNHPVTLLAAAILAFALGRLGEHQAARELAADTLASSLRGWLGGVLGRRARCAGNPASVLIPAL